jgi:hypothetical protein
MLKVFAKVTKGTINFNEKNVKLPFSTFILSCSLSTIRLGSIKKKGNVFPISD